jgi:hypothetical protein
VGVELAALRQVHQVATVLGVEEQDAFADEEGPTHEVWGKRVRAGRDA